MAETLLAKGAREQPVVVGCLMPKIRAAMHLDTVFSFCDRDLVTAYRDVADNRCCYSARRTARAASRPMPTGHLHQRGEGGVGPEELRVVETGGNAWQAAARAVGRRQQRGLLEPGVVVAYDRNTTQHPAAQGGRRGHHHAQRQ